LLTGGGALGGAVLQEKKRQAEAKEKKLQVALPCSAALNPKL